MTKRLATRLPDLLDRVRRATSARGKKSELARWLGTTPQRITDWLAGSFSPGGEVTLLLLEWVTAEEAKEIKAPAVRKHREGKQTRIRRSKHEKPKSGLPKA